jgi:hypothetical protein
LHATKYKKYAGIKNSIFYFKGTQFIFVDANESGEVVIPEESQTIQATISEDGQITITNNPAEDREAVATIKSEIKN